MELSFSSKIVLEVTSAVLAVLSVFCPYLGIVAATIVIVLILNEIATRNSGRADFKNRIVHELWTMLSMLIDIPIGNRDRVPYNEWSAKDAGFQKDALGDDYELWKAFYNSIDNRNDFFTSHEAYHLDDIRKLRQSCLASFLQLFGTSMVQQSGLKERFDDLIAKAKHNKIL